MGSLYFVCDLYSHSETAHGESLWIHQKEQKNFPWRFPNQVIGFSLGLSNHKSSSTNRVKEKSISRNCSTCWAHFCGVALKLRQISWHVPNSLHVGPNMANFRGSLWVYFTCLCSKYPLIRILLVGHSFVMFFFLILFTATLDQTVLNEMHRCTTVFYSKKIGSKIRQHHALHIHFIQLSRAQLSFLGMREYPSTSWPASNLQATDSIKQIQHLKRLQK